MWVIKDFKDELLDESGERQVSENEYFETKLVSFLKSSHRKFKQTRDALVSFFPHRELVTMITPTENKANLSKIDMLDPEDLDPDFNADLNLLQEKVFKETPPKKV
jgi:hypothetical protein